MALHRPKTFNSSCNQQPDIIKSQYNLTLERSNLIALTLNLSFFLNRHFLADLLAV